MASITPPAHHSHSNLREFRDPYENGTHSCQAVRAVSQAPHGVLPEKSHTTLFLSAANRSRSPGCPSIALISAFHLPPPLMNFAKEDFTVPSSWIAIYARPVCAGNLSRTQSACRSSFSRHAALSLGIDTTGRFRRSRSHL